MIYRRLRPCRRIRRARDPLQPSRGLWRLCLPPKPWSPKPRLLRFPKYAICACDRKCSYGVSLMLGRVVVLLSPKPRLRRSPRREKSTYGATLATERKGAEDNTRPHDATPPTAAPTGPSTAEAGTAPKVDKAGHQRSYYAGYGVALCRLPTTYGIHVITTWLCAEVENDVNQMQSKYVVLGRISAQIIQRCEPLAANLRMQVVVNDAGAAHNADAMYHLPHPGSTRVLRYRLQSFHEASRVCEANRTRFLYDR